MKVLMMVSQFFPAGVGGAERQCLRQASALVRRGHEVTILTKWLVPESARREEVDGVCILRWGCFFSLRRAFKRRWAAHAESSPMKSPESSAVPHFGRSRWGHASEWLRNALFIMEMGWGAKTGRLTCDVVHVHTSDWIAGLGQWVGEMMKTPVFSKEAFQPVLLFGTEPDMPWSGVWRKRRLKCRFIAMTDGIAGSLVAAGIPRERIVPIPNGVEIPKEVADPGSSSVAIYAGNFTQGVAHKGFDLLLRAWGNARRQEPGMRLRLYGRGDSTPWRAYADEQGCGDSVAFEGETDDIWAAHRGAGFLVLPSRQEGLSNSLLEAMASGLPAVVSDIPGNLAAIRDGVEGIVVPVGDADALAKAMVRLYRSPELRARMGSAARMRAQEVFAIDKVAAQLEEAYARA